MSYVQFNFDSAVLESVPVSQFKISDLFQMKTGSLFAELKRRKVYRVAVAYALMGWALAQGIAQVFPVFEVPNCIVRLIMVLIPLGFPIALALAWLFELTPEGLKRTVDIPPDKVPDIVRQLWRMRGNNSSAAIYVP